jgi:hypothetical protein
MIAQTRGAASFTAVMTTVALVVLTGGAHAGSIVQTASFQFAEADTMVGTFLQFNPALGTLTGVEISVSGTATGPDYTFTNPTDQPITFTLTTSGTQWTDAGPLPFNISVPSFLLLPPTNRPTVPVSVPVGPIDSSATYLSNLGFWIGTGGLQPFDYAVEQLAHGPPLELQVSADNPNVVVNFFGTEDQTTIGTETITYLFSSPVPEPPSSHMLGTAVLILAGAFWFARFLTGDAGSDRRRGGDRHGVPCDRDSALGLGTALGR